MKSPLISVVTANWNGESVLEDYFESLSKLKYKNWELVFVDNGSSDKSLEMVGKYSQKISVTLVKNDKNLGFAMANNQGYEASSGKYVLFLNNDTKVSSDLLNTLFEKMNSDKKIGVIQPKIYIMDKAGYLDNAGSFMTRIGFLSHWGFGQKDSKEFGKEREIFSAKGACMFVRRVVIERVGLFDPRFGSYFEESDFCWRVWLSGHSVIFFPEIHIFHKVGFTIKRLDVANINFQYYRNRINSQIKNFGIKNLFLILPVHIFISFGISFLFVLRGRFRAGFIIIKAIAWNFIHIIPTLSDRMKIQNKVREVSDKELFKNLMEDIDLGKFYGDFKRVESDIKKK